MANYTMYRGDSHVADIPIEDAEGAPMPHNGVEVIVTAKTDASVPDNEALFQHWIAFDLDGEPVVTDNHIHLANGMITHRIDPDDSISFEPGEYQYDVQISYPSVVVAGEIETETKITGTITVLKDITRTGEVPT